MSERKNKGLEVLYSLPELHHESIVVTLPDDLRQPPDGVGFLALLHSLWRNPVRLCQLQQRSAVGPDSRNQCQPLGEVVLCPSNRPLLRQRRVSKGLEQPLALQPSKKSKNEK